MKLYKPPFSLAILVFFLFAGCSKDPQSSGSTKPSLSLSKSNAKIAEPVLATTSGLSAGSVVHWTTSINGHVGTSATTDSASLVFTSSGTYTVTASYYATNGITPYDSGSATVTVNDSVYSAPTGPGLDCATQDTVKSLRTFDELAMKWILTDSGLVFIATSKLLYNNSAFMNVSGNLTGQGGVFEADFDSTLNYVCYGGSIPGPAYSIISFISATPGVHYGLVLKLNGVTYQGSFTIEYAGVSVVWPYSSGIVFSP
jgi:hypothetical protein